MIEIKTLNKNKLNEYINSDEFYSSLNIPISKVRAISHINNPRADKDDVLLLIAYLEGKMVGYLGLLPDWIYDSNNTKFKVAWMSCIWIDENVRGQGLSKKLIYKAFDCWDNNIIITEYTEPAKKLYIKLDLFEIFYKLEGIRLYNRFDTANVLTKRYPALKNLYFPFKVIDNLFNFLFEYRFIFFNQCFDNLKLEYLSKLDSEIENFIADKSKNQLFKRNSSEINWFLEYPWLLSGTKNDESAKRYFFSFIEKQYFTNILKIKNTDNKLIAVLIYSIRNQNLKIPVLYFEETYTKYVCEVIEYIIFKNKINTASIYNHQINSTLERESKSLFKKNISREFMISKKLKSKLSLDNFIITDSDSDSIFT